MLEAGSVFLTQPAAFIAVALFGTAWAAFDREHFGWQAVATLAVLFVALLIHRTTKIGLSAVNRNTDSKPIIEPRPLPLPAPREHSSSSGGDQ